MKGEVEGGRGGGASAIGEDSLAEGGAGGEAGISSGGDGGDAFAGGTRSRAIGGRGGRGGVGPAGRGGDAYVGRSLDELSDDLHGEVSMPPDIGPSDTYVSVDGQMLLLLRGGGGGEGGSAYVEGADAFAAGGQGGEASQADGRGGRGGRAYMPEDTTMLFPGRRPSHIRWPYFEPITEPGRGGDAADSPQYKARRIIVEQIKKKEFFKRGISLEEAWWDRSVLSTEWINAELAFNGHDWIVRLVDEEYEFIDIK